ncbi:ABC transporter [Clavulina sp. PMI_390]|nr:ABC transporter [Clavulina sp. PMI_390]
MSADLKGEMDPNAEKPAVETGRTSLDTKVQSDASAMVDIEASPEVKVVEQIRWLSGRKLMIVHTAMLLSVLLIAVDQSIVATALPHIVSQFNALDQAAWVATAYFLTQAGFILFFGAVLSIAPTKYVFLVAVSLFELGSLVCGVAPNMNTLIFGRALAGVGAAGIFGACLAIIAEVCPLEKRAALMGSFGGMFAIASVMGPLLGGVFTDKVSWRWCFYINLPIGGISLAVIVVFLKGGHSALNAAKDENETTLQRWLRLDWFGALISLGFIVSLLLPLQWGGNTKSWKDGSVIALFVVFGVIFGFFLAWQYYLKDRALLPLKLLKNRTQIGCSMAVFWLMLSFLAGVYYLPLYYQANGHSATRSGIDILPFMMMTVAGTMISGTAITITGNYLPWLVACPPLSAIRSGLLYTMDVHTPKAKLIGYQILYGFGLGGAFQTTFIAIQAEYNHNESMIPKTTGIVTFSQLVGGAIGVAIAGTIFSNQLVTELHKYASGLDPTIATKVRQSVTYIFTLPVEEQAPVIQAYSRAVGFVFLMGIPAAIFSSLSSLLVRSHDIRKMNLAGGGGA